MQLGQTIFLILEQLDTGNGYNTSDGIYTVPSGEGGTWIFGAAVRPDCTAGALARAYIVWRN